MLKIKPIVFITFVTALLIGCESKSPTEENFTPGIHNKKVVNSVLFRGHYLGDEVGYLISGTDGTILKSKTGLQWQPVDTGYVKETLFGFGKNPKTKVLLSVGESGRIVRSTDNGESWRPYQSNINATLRRVSYSESIGCWMAVGAEGAALQSCDDGKQWTFVQGLPKVSLMHVLSNQGEWFVGSEIGLFTKQKASTEWSRVPGTEGSAITGIYDVKENGSLLVTTNSGVVSLRIEGIWHSVVIDPDPIYVTSLTQSKDKLLLTTDDGTALISKNGGLNWKIQDVDRQYLTASFWSEKLKEFVLIGSGGSAYISDGETGVWARQDLGVSGDFEGLVPLANEGAVAVFGEGGQLVYWDLQQNKSQVLADNLSGYIQDIIWLPNGNIISVGSAGWLRLSKDGGRNWFKPESDMLETDYLFSLAYYPDSKVLLAAGPSGVIFRSEDQGETWKNVVRTSLTTDGYFHKIIVDAKRGWAVATAGPGFIHFSSDEGKTWQVADADPSLHMFNIAQNPETGLLIAVGRDGVILFSQDGLHWQQHTLESKSVLKAVAYHRTTNSWYVAGDDGEIWLSQDEAKSWYKLGRKLGGPVYYITVIDENHLLVTGKNGLLWRTEDAGETWEKVETDLEGSFRKPIYAGAGKILLPTRRGNVLYSTDFGRSWSPLRTKTRESMKRVVLSPDKKIIIAAGNRLVRLSFPGS